MRTRYAITHVNKDGLRTLTLANQGRNHWDDRGAAESWLKLVQANEHHSLTQVIGEEAARTLEVRAVECHDHGDAVGIYFDD